MDADRTNNGAGQGQGLLQVAADLVGGPGRLAGRLGISEPILRKYATGIFPLPDVLLVQVLDLIVEERETRAPGAPSVDFPRAPGGQPEA